MIKIRKSKTADTRSCDFSQVSKEQLRESSLQHIENVTAGVWFFQNMLDQSAKKHDFDKLTELDHFHADFITGFKETGWWDTFGCKPCRCAGHDN